MKHKVAIVKFGHVSNLVDFQKIKNWKSKLFEIVEIDCIEHLRDFGSDDGYLDVKYSKCDLGKLITCPNGADYAVAIVPYRFEDGYYMHFLGESCVAISLYGIPEILNKRQIAVENFIIRNIYEVCAIKHLVSEVTPEQVYAIPHRDTRGCLFDYNGEVTDILHNTEKPIVCEECKGKFRAKQINERILLTIEKELNKINKPWVLVVEQWVKRYPLLSILISAAMAISLNIAADILLGLLK